MEMSLRVWLFVLGVVIIAVVFVDCLRRVRRARQDKREIAVGMGAEPYDSPAEDNSNPELPSSGFRVIRQGEDSANTVSSLNQEPPEPFSALDEELPPQPLDDLPLSATDTAQYEPSALQTEPGVPPQEAPAPQAESGGYSEGYNEAGEKEEANKEIAETRDQDDKEIKSSLQTKKSDKRPPRKKEQDLQEVIVVNVLAKDGQVFEGGKLQSLVEACGLQFGDMSIYHRHEYDYNKGPVQFSMANIQQPGTFTSPLEDTSGVCFFVRLPGPDKNMQAFDYMLETAQCVVRNLGGEMKDEQHSVMTPQTIEHCRQRVREFERRQLSQRA